MFSNSTRARCPGLMLFAVALSACSDSTNPTEARPNVRSHLAVGDVIVVTSAVDGADGSLRTALSQTTGGEIIRFSPGLAGDTLFLETTLDIQKRVTIEGPADRGITISGAEKHTVLRVRESGATLVNLTITGGKSDVDVFAGGITSVGPLVLDHSTVADNQGGSAIRGDTITLINSTVTNNTTPNSGSFVVAGINYNFHGTLTLINSTVSYNVGGAGIGPFGITSDKPVVTLRNSIISNHEPQNCRGTEGFIYEGRDASDDESCGKTVLVMRIGDPRLGPLANNGGPTATRALDRNSFAINDGVNCNVTTDQRYVARDATCDLGAFEFVNTTVALSIDQSARVDPKTGAVTITGTLRCSRDETFDLAVTVEQEQKVKRLPTFVTATRTLPVACQTTTQPWIALVVPASGQVFDNSSVDVSAATVNLPNGITAASALTSLKPAWAKK